MLDPAIGIGRIVRILLEDLLRADVLLELDQKTLAAHVRVKGIEGFWPVELFRGDVTLAKRRHAQIDEREIEARATEAASRRFSTGSRGH